MMLLVLQRRTVAFLFSFFFSAFLNARQPVLYTQPLFVVLRSLSLKSPTSHWHLTCHERWRDEWSRRNGSTQLWNKLTLLEILGALSLSVYLPVCRVCHLWTDSNFLFPLVLWIWSVHVARSLTSVMTALWHRHLQCQHCQQRWTFLIFDIQNEHMHMIQVVHFIWAVSHSFRLSCNSWKQWIELTQLQVAMTQVHMSDG